MQFQVMNGDISINEGALTENFVATTLAAKQVPLHYYDKKSRQELDFVISENERISHTTESRGIYYLVENRRMFHEKMFL